MASLRGGFRADFLDAVGVKAEHQGEAVRVLVLDSGNKMVGHTDLDFLVKRLGGSFRASELRSPSMPHYTHHVAGQQKLQHRGENSSTSGRAATRGSMSESYAAELERTGEREASVLTVSPSGVSPTRYPPFDPSMQNYLGYHHHHQQQQQQHQQEQQDHHRQEQQLASREPTMMQDPQHHQPPSRHHQPHDESLRGSHAGGLSYPEPSSDAPIKPGLEPLAEKLGQLERLWQGMQRLQTSLHEKQQELAGLDIAATNRSGDGGGSRGGGGGGGKQHGNHWDDAQRAGQGDGEMEGFASGVGGHQEQGAGSPPHKGGGVWRGQTVASPSSSSSSSSLRRNPELAKVSMRLESLEHSLSSMVEAQAAQMSRQRHLAVSRALAGIRLAALRWSFGAWRGVTIEAIRLLAMTGGLDSRRGLDHHHHHHQQQQQHPSKSPRSPLSQMFSEPPRPPPHPETASKGRGGDSSPRDWMPAASSPGRGTPMGSPTTKRVSIEAAVDGKYMAKLEKDNASLRALLAEISVAYEDSVQRLHRQGLEQLQHQQHHVPASSQGPSSPTVPRDQENPPYIRREGSRAAPVIHRTASTSSTSASPPYIAPPHNATPHITPNVLYSGAPRIVPGSESPPSPPSPSLYAPMASAAASLDGVPPGWSSPRASPRGFLPTSPSSDTSEVPKPHKVTSPFVARIVANFEPPPASSSE